MRNEGKVVGDAINKKMLRRGDRAQHSDSPSERALSVVWSRKVTRSRYRRHQGIKCYQVGLEDVYKRNHYEDHEDLHPETSEYCEIEVIPYFWRRSLLSSVEFSVRSVNSAPNSFFCSGLNVLMQLYVAPHCLRAKKHTQIPASFNAARPPLLRA